MQPRVMIAYLLVVLLLLLAAAAVIWLARNTRARKRQRWLDREKAGTAQRRERQKTIADEGVPPAV